MTTPQSESRAFREPIGPMEIRLGGIIVAVLIGANPVVTALKADREAEPRTITLQLDRLRDDIQELKSAINDGNRLFSTVNQRVSDVDAKLNLWIERVKELKVPPG